jgi:hypothetical protein
MDHRVLGSIPEQCNIHWSVMAILYSTVGVFSLGFCLFFIKGCIKLLNVVIPVTQIQSFADCTTILIPAPEV